jgi:large repetitive protein
MPLSPVVLRGALTCCVLAVLFARPAVCAEPILVEDIKREQDPLPTDQGSHPRLQVRLGDWIYFSALDRLHGDELWRTDGTAGGTERVTDLCPGPCSATPESLTAFGGRIFFSAFDGVTGRELWVSDGTPRGTRPVRDICPGECSGVASTNAVIPLSLAALEEEVFFPANDGVTGFELWKSDGTPEGTERVADIRPGAESSNPRIFTSLAGWIVFSATEPARGQELWLSDGTAAGTRVAKDLCPENCSSAPSFLAVTEDDVLVLAKANRDHPRVWRLDRSGRMFLLPGACAPECTEARAVRFGGGLILSLLEGDFSSDLHARIWRVAPGEDRGELLQELALRVNPQWLTAVGDRVFFTALTAVPTGFELWVTDGTPAGTRPVGGPPNPQWLAPLGDRVVFAAEGGGLWVSDGTPAGTLSLGTGILSATHLMALGGQVVFSASSEEIGQELWRTDGTPQGTGLVEDLNLDPGSSDPAELAAWNGRLYFAATSNDTWREPWVSDGTAAGTDLLRDLSAGIGTSNPSGFTPFGDLLYFGAFSGEGALWRTDGTRSGTLPVPGAAGEVGNLTLAGSSLFLAADPPEDNCRGGCPELFRLAAGAAQVSLVKDINPFFPDTILLWLDENGSHASGLTPQGAGIVFSADDGESGGELWGSDGTGAGTARVADLCPGFCSSSPRGLTRLGAWTLFATGGSEFLHGLWRTDGTTAGTIPLRSFSNPSNSPGIREIVVAGDHAFFLVPLPGGHELWASDGTVEGTVRVSDLRVDGTPARARRLAAVGSRVFFAAWHPATGEELWTSDGTAAGTRRLGDLHPGPRGSFPQSLAAVGDRLVFAADDGISGLEPWVSDGTPRGTHRLADVASGPDASSPRDFTVVGDLLFFAAGDPVHGRELWTVPLAALDEPACIPTDDTLCLLGGRFAVSVRWQVPGREGAGHALAQSDETGFFWFFDPENTELLVKMLDGGPVNGHAWLFTGALSDVEYEVTVRDVVAGTERVYRNRRGDLCGRTDTAAFPLDGRSTAFAVLPPPTAPAEAGGCGPASDALCLGGGRFQVEVTFRNPLDGGAETRARAVPGGDQTGYFWFFDPGNLELAVKVLDGTALNGKHWVFWGALSDVEYEIAVTDTATGARKTYRNPRGQICGGADTEAF